MQPSYSCTIVIISDQTDFKPVWVAARAADTRGWLACKLRDELHLNRCVKGKLRDTHGRAGVQPGLSEDFAYKLRCSVDDPRLQVEAWSGGDEGAGGFGHGGQLEAELTEAGLRIMRHLAQGHLVLGGVVDQGVAVVQG